MASLTITSGPGEGRRIECDRELVIGRGSADIVVEDDQMSRRHATVRPVPGGVEVEDLDSLNGTFVNEERITGKVTLTEATTIRIGVTQFAVEVPQPEPGVAPEGATRISASPPADATVVRDRPSTPVGPPPVPVAGPPAGVPPVAGPPAWAQEGGGPPPGVGGPPGGGPPGGGPPGGGPPGGGPPPWGEGPPPWGDGPPPWAQGGGGPPGGGPPNLKGPMKLLAKTPLGKLMFKRKMKRMAKQQNQSP
jgi:hypothetical protein